jgi:hypothetical protein
MVHRIIDFDDLTSLEGTDLGVIVDSSTETTKKFTMNSLTTYALNDSTIKTNIGNTYRDLWLGNIALTNSSDALEELFNYFSLVPTMTRIEIDILNDTIDVYNNATLVRTKAIDSTAQIISIQNATTSNQDVDIINSGEYSDGTTSITLTPRDNLCIYLDRTNNKAIILSKVLTP